MVFLVIMKYHTWKRQWVLQEILLVLHKEKFMLGMCYVFRKLSKLMGLLSYLSVFNCTASEPRLILNQEGSFSFFHYCSSLYKQVLLNYVRIAVIRHVFFSFGLLLHLLPNICTFCSKNVKLVTHFAYENKFYLQFL